MKNIIGIFVFMVAAMIFVSCEPIEKRNEMKGAVTEADINQYVTVTTEMRDGNHSNWILCRSDGLKALTSFDYGAGTYVGTNGRVQVFETGDQTVVLTVLNRDGTKITKNYSVTVDELYDLAVEWDYLCDMSNTRSKTWTWNEELGEECYGEGDVTEDVADWWNPAIPNVGEGFGATMTFSVKGMTLVKEKTDGSKEEGVFSFDMNGKLWDFSIAKFSTKGVTILGGKDYDGEDTYEFQITRLNEDELIFVKLMEDAGWDPDVEGWGDATLWIFKAVED